MARLLTAGVVLMTIFSGCMDPVLSGLGLASDDELPALESGDPIIRSMEQNVRDFLKNDRLDEAMTLIDDTLRRKPENDHAFYLRALVFQRMGNIERALADIGCALMQKPGEREYLLKRAELSVLAENYAQAISDAEEVVRESDDAHAREIMARAKFFERNYAGAAHDAERAIGRGRATPENHILMITAKDGAGRSEDALSDSADVCKLFPEHADVLTLRGDLLDAAGDKKGARLHYKRALKVAPYHTPALVRRAAILSSLGRFAEALELAERAAAVEAGFAPAWREKCVALCGLGKFEEAVGAGERAASLAQNDVSCLVEFALACEAGQMHDRALKIYADALAIDPACRPALLNRGGLYFRLGRLNDAVRDAESLIEIDSKNVGAYVLKGAAYLRGGNPVKAQDALGVALAIDPEDPEALFNNAVALLLLRRNVEALACLDKYPDDADASRGYVRDTIAVLALMRLARYAESIGRIDQMLACGIADGRTATTLLVRKWFCLVMLGKKSAADSLFASAGGKAATPEVAVGILKTGVTDVKTEDYARISLIEGLVKFGRGEISAARDCFNRAISITDARSMAMHEAAWWLERTYSNDK